MTVTDLKVFLRTAFILFLTIVIVACDENKKNNDTDSKIKSDMNIELNEEHLIEIPQEINEETERYEIDKELVAVNVFNSNSSQNIQVDLLKNLFPKAEITQAEASEVFDSHNILYKGESYCAVVVYEQNTDEEYVIHTIFIHKGSFSEKILAKIFS